MEFDAVILAGGRSARLGGVPKSRLIYDGASLLHLTLAAARGARITVVVGPEPGPLPAGIFTCREDPPFTGPAAAIAAGLDTLNMPGISRCVLTLVLACDMPGVAGAITVLEQVMEAQASAGGQRAEGVVAVSADGRRQPLVGFYSTPALERAAAEASERGALNNGSVWALLASLDLQLATVPAGSTADVDTWDDAAALGVSGQQPEPKSVTPQLQLNLEADLEEPG